MSDLQEPMPEIQHLISVLIVQQQRIYDTMLTLIGHFNSEAAYNLIQVHERMENIGPVPYKIDNVES